MAQHPRLPRHDALKILPTEVSADREFRERFNREADLAATLWHPHIVGIHDRGEFDGQLWISMDYVDGADAAYLMKTRYPAGMTAPDVSVIVTAMAGRSATPISGDCCIAMSSQPISCSPRQTAITTGFYWPTSE